MEAKRLEQFITKFDQEDLIVAQKVGVKNYLQEIYADLKLLAESDLNVHVAADAAQEQLPKYTRDSEEAYLQIIHRLEKRKKQFALELLEIRTGNFE